MTETNLSGGFLYSVSKPIIPTSPIPSGRGGCTSVYVDGKLIVFGGHYYAGNDKFEYINEIWVLQIETLTWTKINCQGDIPSSRYGHTAHLVGSKMFIFGGRGPNGAIYNDIYCIDLCDWTWILIVPSTSSPSPRFFHASELVGRKIVIHGGWDGENILNDFWIFNTELFSWMQPRTAGFGPSPRYGHTLTLLQDGRLFVFGGCIINEETGIPKYHNDVHVLDTETMIWIRPRINGKTPTGRYGHSATLLDNGQIVIFGGWGSGGCQSKELIKDPDAHSLQILDTQSMIWWVPVFRKAQQSNNTNTLTKTSKQDMKHLYNHSSCRATNTSSICIFGGFDGRQSTMDFSVVTVEAKE